HMKGWLPAATLKDGKVQANQQFAPPDGNYPAIRYMVYRNAASTLDLTRAENNYKPRKDSYNADNFSGSGVSTGHHNVTNLCEKIQRASPLVVSVTSHGPLYISDAGHEIYTHKDIWQSATPYNSPKD